MKYIIPFLLLLSGQLYAQSSIYDYTALSVGGKQLLLSDYKGTKVLIAAISSERLQQKNTINYWDSLQTANPKVVFILLPAIDISANTDTSQKISLIQPKSGKVILTNWVNAKKDKGSQQYPLLQWLTHVNQNGHFDSDVSSENQIYVINEAGVLYAVLDDGVPAKFLDDIIKQPIQ